MNRIPVVVVAVSLFLLVSLAFRPSVFASPGSEQPSELTTSPLDLHSGERAIGVEFGILIPYTLVQYEGEYTEQLDNFFFEEKPSTLPRSRLFVTLGLTYDVYEWYLDDLVRGHEFMYYDYPVTHFITGVQNQTINFFTDIHPVTNKQDAEEN